jgi:hypothetical protein
MSISTKTIVSLLAMLAVPTFVVASDEKVGGDIPPKTILAANVVKDGKWYALSNKELACLKELLKTKPFQMPEGVTHVSLPAFNNSFVLWGMENNQLVQIEAIAFNDRVRFLNSSQRDYLMNLDESKEQKVLVDLIDRIEQGKEQPLDTESKTSAIEDDTAKQVAFRQPLFLFRRFRPSR